MMPSQTSIVLYSMQTLKNEGSWCGETHIQKALYLCQELMNVPSDFKFILYKHGPYSFELSEHLQGLIADDLVIVRTRPPYGPSLEITDEAKILASRVCRDDKLVRRISFIAKKLSKKGVSDLEKLATAAFVNHKHGAHLSIEKRAEILSSIKQHVPIDAARNAFREIGEIEGEARSLAV
jgi:uncharacterized protein YwgA